MKSNKLKREPKYIAKFKAFPYQQEAVDAVKDLEYAAIFHEQGLGKTKIAIDVLLYWLSECSMDTALIVTKKQLVANWVNEFKDHTSIKPAVLNTDKNNNYRIFCGPYRVVLTNFETLETEKQQFELYLKVRNVGIIIDESAKLKNPNSKLTKTYFELAPLFQRRIIMTGTPVANRPYDIWAQIYFLDFGESLGADFNEFKKETDLSNKLSRNTDLQEEFEDNISQIFNRISSFTVRETKNSGIITLPDKVYIQEVTEFNRMQEELYERIRTELYAEVVRDGERYIDDSSAIVKRLLRLIQVTSNPKLVDEECEASAKEPLLDELIQKILANGEKCIVWSNFIENIDYFTKKYQDLGAVKIHGKMNMDARNRSVQKFHDDDIRILFATPASAKECLTITMANHVIFYDRGFSLDDYLQAQDRIHRISQKKTCYVHNIIIKDSIDEWVDLLLKAKQNAAALSQGDISLGDYQGVADYSFGDIVKSILGFEEVDEYGGSMGIRVIGQKKFEVTETELLQQDLLFYLDNPRVYSVLHENGHDNPTQTEIEEIMCSLDHVKSLKSQIMQNGGLIEPLIVVKRKDRYVVLEGNSRLAAYRILAKNDPLKWSRVLVQILPEDISDSDIFTLLGTFHLNPKKDWSKFEQAAYIYRQKKELGCSDSALGKQVGISAITVKKYCEIYGLMVEHNDTHQSHWNMYEQYVQNKGIKQYRNTYPEMDSFFAKQVKTGEIVRAQDVRDILGKIASDEGKSSTHIMQDYIKGDIDLEEAHARFEATGRSGDNYEKVKKFQRLISEKDFCDELKKEAVGNSKDILFSLRKINTAVTQLMKEIDKKK